jgi:erythronate-4-phosphate dehydrogenase
LIKILADQNLYRLEQFLPVQAETTFYDPHAELPDLDGFDAWLLRTVTKINPDTFPVLPSSLKFVGTGSSGSDHLDPIHLEKHNILTADAKGCNARAVAEYVMTSLLLWQDEKETTLTDLTYGIVGAGAVGSAVAESFDAFDLNYKMYDPPREEREAGFLSCSLNEVLECDVLTFHVPYEENEPYPTHHWLDEEKLNGRVFELIINAARGGVIKESAVSDAVKNGSVRDLIIDVWEQEPDFDPDFAIRPFIATPHIAGYSEQAKLNASKFMCIKLCDFFNLDCPGTEMEYPVKELHPAHLKYSFKELLLRINPIKEYDVALRDLIGRPDKAELFTKLREDRPYRFEYSYLSLEPEFLKGVEVLKKLGVLEASSE